MKFVCQHCKSKYTISDEKIRNKRLKIRCKKCRNIIEIIDPTRGRRPSMAPQGQLSMDEPVSLVLGDPDESIPGVPSSLEQQFAASFQKRPEPKKTEGTPGLYGNLQQQASRLEKDERDQAIWFVAVDNSPVGPITARAVHKYKQAGRISDDTLTWKEGMPDWTVLRSNKELIGLLARIDLDVSDSVKAEPKLKKTAPSHNLGLYGAAAQDREQPLKGANVGVIGADQPSVDPAIAFFEAGNGPASPTESTPSTIGAGVGTDISVDIEDELNNEVSRLHSLTPPRSGGNRVYLLASVGFFVTAVITLFMVISGSGEATGDPQSVQTVEKIVEKVVYRDRIVEKEVFRDRKNESASSKSGSRKSSASRVKKTQSGKKGPTDERTRELMKRFGMDAPGTRGPIGGVKNSHVNGNGKNFQTSTLTPNQMKQVVNKNKRALKSCYERSLKKGEASDSRDLRVNFKMTVGKSGTVRSVTLSGEGASLPTLNTCLNRSVKQWVFPSTAGESNLEFPFVFTPTR